MLLTLLAQKPNKRLPLLLNFRTRKSMLSSVISPWTNSRLSWLTILPFLMACVLGVLIIVLQLHFHLASDIKTLRINDRPNAYIAALTPSRTNPCRPRLSPNRERYAFLCASLSYHSDHSAEKAKQDPSIS